MDLSIIIVNYNVRAFLENALTSVRKAAGGMAAEIIVVDNASDDGSVEMLRQKFPDVILIANTRNVGFAAANNQGMTRAAGRYILLLNPDTVVQEDTFKTMTAFFEDHPDAGLAGCKILNPDGTLQLACRRSFPTPWVAFTKVIGLSTLFPRTRLFGRYNLEYLDPERSYEVDAVSGSFMFLRRAIVEKVGGLDEQFFMYGEDLDWCYRVKQAGYAIYYVHATQIIHYKGESARRSDIDDVKMFYEAMRLFVRKHFRRDPVSDLILRCGIALRERLASFGRISKPLSAALLDFIMVNLSLMLGELIWFGEFFRFPSYAYPATMTIPGLLIVATLYFSGLYTTRKLSVPRAGGAVLVGYILLAALTFFFKHYAFSRMVLVISGGFSMIILPGWRLFGRAVLRSPAHRRRSLFGRRTVIVGPEVSGQEVLRKLRARIDDGYEVVGFIDVNRKRIGEKVSGVEILGSIDNIGKVIQEQKVSEVIFSTDILSYADILSVISRSRSRSVNFRLVPNSLEVIIGKTHIDELDDIPLVEITYNIDRPVNRLFKRAFDIGASLILLATVYPFVRLHERKGGGPPKFYDNLIELPRVFQGTMSLVGPTPGRTAASRNGSSPYPSYWGKPGLTGLLQVNYHEDLTAGEIEKYNLYYAKNQSLMLDIEILLKSLITHRKR